MALILCFKLAFKQRRVDGATLAGILQARSSGWRHNGFSWAFGTALHRYNSGCDYMSDFFGEELLLPLQFLENQSKLIAKPNHS